MTIFLIDRYKNPVDMSHTRLSGKVSPLPSNLYGKVDRGPRAVFVSRQLDWNLLKHVAPDILISDYAYDLSESTEFQKEDFSSNYDLYIQLPAFTANVKRFYAGSLFDTLTGEPASDLIGERIGTHDYTVRFWKPEWYSIIDEFLQRIAKLRPLGVLVRGMDRGDDRAIDLLKFIASKALIYGIPRVIAETIKFLGNSSVIKNVHGVSVPGLFYTDPEHRTSLNARLERQGLLEEIGKNKAVFIFDRVHDQFQEVVARSRSRGFIPVLKVDTENGLLNEEIIEPHHTTPVHVSGNHWKAHIEELRRGTNRVQFVSSFSHFNTALIDYRPPSWQEMIKTARFTVLDAESCTITLGTRQVHVKNELSTRDFLLLLRKNPFEIIPEFTPRSEFLIGSFSSQLYEQWLSMKELKPLLDRFTYPIVLSRGKESLHATVGEHSVSFAESALREDGKTDHRLLMIRGLHNRSSIVLCFGNEFALKTLSYILDNIGNYAEILNDEDTTLVIARTDAETAEEYIPSHSNILISPLVEHIK